MLGSAGKVATLSKRLGALSYSCHQGGRLPSVVMLLLLLMDLLELLLPTVAVRAIAGELKLLTVGQLDLVDDCIRTRYRSRRGMVVGNVRRGGRDGIVDVESRSLRHGLKLLEGKLLLRLLLRYLLLLLLEVGAILLRGDVDRLVFIFQREQILLNEFKREAFLRIDVYIVVEVRHLKEIIKMCISGFIHIYIYYSNNHY